MTVRAGPATQVGFKNCAQFTKRITKIDETTINYVKNLDLVMPIYSLIEYSLNYSKTAGRLWFYSKDEATDFNADISIDNYFKSFEDKAKLLENTTAQSNPNQANGILKNAAIVVPLKYLSNFWRSTEMSLINCKVDVLPSAGNENDVNDNANNIIFTIKDTKFYVLLVTLSAADSQKLLKVFSKGFERLVYWNGFKTKGENKNKANEFRYFLESNFLGVNRLFALVYTNEDVDPKTFKAKRYYLPKSIIKNYNVIINGKIYMIKPLI